MKNPASKSLTFHLSAFQRSAMIVAACALVLGLVATGLLNVRAQSQSRSAVELARPLPSELQKGASTASQSVIVNWPSEGRKQATYDDYLRSLRGDERMSAKVVPTRGSGDGSPQFIIVIYGGHGQVIACIGRASACKELMA
jgi:hypothetical protein